MQKQRHQTPSLWPRLTLVATVLLMSLWLAGVDGGLLEEGKIIVQVNDVDSVKKAHLPVCISTENSGVLPCDADPRCCKPDSPRVKGTDYCCPPGSYQYHFKSGKDDVCACGVQ